MQKVCLEIKDGIVEIDYDIFKHFSEAKFDFTDEKKLKKDLSKHDISMPTMEILLRYMNEHFSTIKQERIPIDKQLKSSLLKNIYKTSIDVQLFGDIQNNRDLISELIAVAYELKCDTIWTKATALFVIHIKRDITTSNPSRSVDILTAKLTGF